MPSRPEGAGAGMLIAQEHQTMTRRDYLQLMAAGAAASATARARSGEGMLRARPRRGPARRLLLLPDGLAPPRWGDLRHRRSRPPTLRRLQARADSRTAHHLRQDRHPLVRRLLAARCPGL